MNKNEMRTVVPDLRFPEFRDSDKWEEAELGAVATLLKGKGISKSDIAMDGSLPCIRYGELYTYYNETIDHILSYTNLSPDKLVLSESNDVIIPSSGETEEDISRASCVLRSGIALGGDLNIIRTRLDGSFLSYYINHVKKKDIAQLAQGIAVVHLYSSQLKNVKIHFPKLEEQKKIAFCLSSLDEVIAAHSQKLELLQDHKKGLMQNLFPQEGDKIPKYRFPEFEKEGEWVEKTFGQVSKTTTGSKDTQNKVDNGKYPFFVRSQTVEHINSYSFDGEAILTSGDGVGVGKNFHYINGKFDFHQRVYCIYDFAEEVSGQFVYIYFFQHFYERVMRMSAKNSVDSVRMAMITEMPITLPSKREQRRIADCFSSLNELITAQVEEIEQLKLHKKGLMQGLFPKTIE